MRVIGHRHFTDDPLVVQREVFPGRMTLGKEGVLLAVCMFGAFFGNLFWGPLADKHGRKPILEASTFLMFVFSVGSVSCLDQNGFHLISCYNMKKEKEEWAR